MDFALLLAQTEILIISDGTVMEVAQKLIMLKWLSMRRTERACICPALEHAPSGRDPKTPAAREQEAFLS
jgi:hypothetical protein